MIRRHRPSANAESSSSDDEDAFSSLVKCNQIDNPQPKILIPDSQLTQVTRQITTSTDFSEKVSKTSEVKCVGNIVQAENLPIVTKATSSHKRHHHMSTERTAKLDALLQELQADATHIQKTPARPSSPEDFYDGFVPNKKGSFVTGSEEASTTTNIFVGNLDPSVTEEMLTDLFRQFGEIFEPSIPYWVQTACLTVILHSIWQSDVVP